MRYANVTSTLALVAALGGTSYVTVHCLAGESGATFDAGDLTVMAVAD